MSFEVIGDEQACSTECKAQVCNESLKKKSEIHNQLDVNHVCRTKSCIIIQIVQKNRKI